MKIKKIRLINYRNYSDEQIEFDEGLNIIKGNNAQGKTNLLEAIYFCAIGKSMRVSREKELINWDKENAKIELYVQKKYRNTKIEISFSKKDKKTVKINGIPIKRIGELLGEMNCVFFAPSELKLIQDSPEDRRRFIDIDISQTSKNYFYLLNRYEKILANRNKLLKSSMDIKSIKDTISIWDEQLSTIGAKIIIYRQQFLKDLTPYVVLAHKFLTNDAEEISLAYTGIDLQDESQIKTELLNLLIKNFEKDFKLGFTTIGPHRDDIKVTINGIDIRTYGSQGQQRTAALSMKLAELEIIKNQTNEMPILLLDDVFSELDENRRKKLIRFAEKTQTIITCTDFEFSSKQNKTIIINNGLVV